MEITTNTLVQKIAEGREFHRVMEDSRENFTDITVSEYLNSLLQLSIGMELDLKETQQLLKTAGKSILYAKIKRDAAVIYGITHHMDVMEVQGLLASIQAPLLGEA